MHRSRDAVDWLPASHHEQLALPVVDVERDPVGHSWQPSVDALA